MANWGFKPYLAGPLWDVCRVTGTQEYGNENENATSSKRETRMRFSMYSEEERLRTFQNWPRDAPVTPSDLARAGFYFLEFEDTVQCFYCHGILGQWVQGDSPLGEHQRHFPTCGFILGRNVGNVPRPPGSSDSVDGQILSRLQRMTVDELVTTGQAVHPEMESEDTRLTTFHNWPREALVQPNTLVPAGFFYTGHGDNVTCFFCDGGLRNWEPGDDPWQEHAKWFPRCEFLLQTRGQDYVNTIQSYPGGRNQTSTAGNITTNHGLLNGQSGVAAAMLSPVVEAALQMGFRQSLVESLVQARYLLTGGQYTSVSNLVADVLQAEQEQEQEQEEEEEEEEERQSSEPSTEPVVRQGCSTGGMATQTSSAQGNLSTEEKLKQLQEERTCKVCLDKQVSMVFVPCGHLVVCTDCATSLHHCPICRAAIRGSIRTFMS